MRNASLLMAISLTACSPRVAGDIAPPPDRLLVACSAPQTWARGTALTQSQTEIRWGRDRAALRDCGERHELLARWARGQIEAE